MATRVRDDLGRELTYARPPSRVLSLVPSDTYTLFALGAGERLVGRTRYCVEPAAEVASIPQVGGTKDPDTEAVAALAPDLILANQEENARPTLEALARRGLPVFVSFPRRFADGVAHVARLARLLGLEQAAPARALLRRGYRMLSPPHELLARVFVPIWMDPLMTVSGETFASDLLLLAGADNVFADRERRYPLAADLGRREPLPPERVAGRDTRYPRITLEEVADRDPDLVLLPDEPHRFSEEDAEVFRRLDMRAARTGAIRLFEGKDLFWHGARAIEGLPRLRRLVREVSSPDASPPGGDEETGAG